MCAARFSFKQVEALQWISGRPPPELARAGSMRLRVKTRHGPQMRDCLLRLVLPPSPMQGGEAAAAAAAVAGAAADGIDGGARASDGGMLAATAAATGGYVNLDTKDSALAPGQFAAFYVGDECVGAGVMCGWSAAAAAAVDAVPAGEGAAAGVGPELAVAKEGPEKGRPDAVLQQQGAGAAAAGVGC